MPFFDFHIHTKFSSCCKQYYFYPDIWPRIKESGLDGFGVCDHSNYRSFNASFVLEQKKQQKDLHLEQTGLVGLETSIVNRRGDLGVNPKLLPSLDYLILAEHVHVAKPFSGFFTFKAHMLKLMQDYPHTELKINKGLDKLLELELNGIRRNHRTIFAHILRFPVHLGFITPKVLEMTDIILESLQTYEIALELHSSFKNGFNISPEKMKVSQFKSDYSMHEFFHHLAHRMRSYSLRYALGSDAHNLAHLYSKIKWQAFLEQIGVVESQLITPEFFLNQF
jgi:histidinol phosphatase-like PHP family hydrolase